MHVPAVVVSSMLAAALSLGGSGPRIERGSPRELHGVQRLHVMSTDPALRSGIVARLRSALPGLTVVENPEEAEVILVVTIVTETLREAPGSGACGSCQTPMSLPPPRLTRATASVVRPAGTDRWRQLAKSSWSGTSSPALCHQVARDFVTIYRKANPESAAR